MLSTHGRDQVLVYHDLLGMMQHPHHAKVTPKFCKQYGNVGSEIERALTAYHTEVKQRQFPSEHFSPYHIAGESSWPHDHATTSDVAKGRRNCSSESSI